MSLNNLFKNTIFLLGAGASKDAGCMMSSQMLDRLHQEINQITADDKIFGDLKEGFKSLYSIIMPALAYQAEFKKINSGSSDIYKPNIEDYILILRKIINKDYIIPEPLVGSWSDKLLSLEIRYDDLCRQYLNFIYYCVIKWLTPDNYESAVESLAPIKRLLESTNDEEFYINIFTLNYDLVFEKVFNSEYQSPINTGFSSNVWDETAFDIEHSKINLFKLHGSLDWYTDEDETFSMANNDIAFNFSEPDERKPHLILGYENKLFSVDPFFTLIQKFIEKLNSARLVVIIGYSFFDSYLNNILIKFLNSSDDKKLFIVDPWFSSKVNPAESFAEYLKVIQTDNSTLNIDNYTLLPSSKVAFFKSDSNAVSGAKEFYSEYFENKCEKLINEYSTLEAKDEPF